MNKKEIFLLSIGIFLTVLAWLIADIYRAATFDKIKVKIEIPKINNYEIKKDIFDKLKQKIN
jgi:hypothetical protein